MVLTATSSGLCHKLDISRRSVRKDSASHRTASCRHRNVEMTLTTGPFRRRALAGSSPLSTGAIVGLALGVAFLFLAAASLFVLYWRRMKHHADEQLWHDCPYPMPTDTHTRRLAYTMDHKSPPFDRSMHSPETASPTTVQSPPASPEFNESLQHIPSAMPTHPAYVPRAVVRQNTSSRAVSSGAASSSGALSAGAVAVLAAHRQPLEHHSYQQAPYPEPQQQDILNTIPPSQPSAATAVELTGHLSHPITTATNATTMSLAANSPPLHDRLASVPEAGIASVVHSVSLGPLNSKRKHKMRRSDSRARRRREEAESAEDEGLFG